MINKKLKKYIKKHPKQNALCIFLIILENIIWLANTFFNIKLTNEAISRNRKEFLVILMYSFATMIILVVVKRFGVLSEKKLSQFIINDIRGDASLCLINSISSSEFDSSGKYVSNFTTDVSYVRSNGLDSYFQIVRSFVSIVFSLVGAAFVHWSYLIIFPITMLISMITPKILAEKFEKSSLIYSNSRENFITRVTDIINGFSIFKRNNKQDLFKDKITDFSSDYEKDVYQYYVKTSFYQSLISFASILSQFIYVLASLILVFMGYISVGSIVGLFNFSQSIYAGISTLFNAMGTISSINPIMEKLLPMFYSQENIEIECVNDISLKNLSIAYGSNEVVSSLSCNIKRGEKVAIVGGSGSGKSTLVKSIMKEILPSSGKILINNIDITEISQHSIYNNIAIVSQDPYLFNTTIRDNIEFGDKFSDEVINSLIDKLSLTEFIDGQKNGLNTYLKNNGENISGGQRQRIVILRELLKNKDVIIFDEGTSSLDKRNKDLIEDFLMKSSVTVLYITHPRSDDELKKFDKVIKL